MKRISLLIMIALVAITTMAFSQSKNKSVEVIYFKARQCACKTRVCDALENQVKAIIKEDFPYKYIDFKHIWLDDKENAALIEKYHATGQTVVMVKTKRKKVWSTDLTEPVKNLTVIGKTDSAEAELKKLIVENL